MYTIKLSKKKVGEKLPDNFIFICFASFEERCTSIIKAINPNSVQKSYILSSESLEDNEVFKKNHDEIESILKNNRTRVILKLNKPLAVAEELTNIIKDIFKDETINNKLSLVIDITTFTHETLLMLLRLLHINSKHFVSIQCLYTGALSYSGYDHNADPKLVWLSKGCHDVRNVIGYPGVLNPTEKNILVLLTGFEVERATRLIDMLNPDCVIVGKGDKEEPTDKNHIDTMEHMSDLFDKWVKSNEKLVIGTFTFSCSDVEKARDDILSQIKECQESNYIIIPLNTKISTIATALVSFMNPVVQVCYAVPEIYNTTSYSQPGNNVTVIDLKRIITNCEL